MQTSSPENLFEDLFAEEKKEFAEIDFSSLLDFSFISPPAQPALSPKTLAAEKYLVFHLDEKLYGIRSESVAEIISAIPVTPLPNVRDWMAGIANLRGTIISIIDLRKLWKKPAYSSPKPRLIVLRPAKNDAPIAFLVDKVNDIALIPASKIDFSAADFQSSFPTFFGKTEFNSTELFLIDSNQIFSSLTVGNPQIL